MKLKNVFKKMRQWLSFILPLLGMFTGLVLVPAFWDTLLEKDHFYYVIYSLMCLPFLVLYYNSFIRLKTTYNEELYSLFESELSEDSTKKDYCAFLLHQKSFWVQYAVIAFLFILIPIRTTVPVIAWLFGAWGNFGKELLALGIFLPFLFLVYLSAHISAIEYWQQERRIKLKVSKKTKISTYATVIGAYAIVPFALLMAFNFLKLYVPLVFKLAQISSSAVLIVLIVAVILFAVFFNLFRVLFTRKKCIKKIKKVCAEMGFELTQIKHPYLSAFCVCRGESFRITTHQKTYSCKLVGAPKKLVPLVIHPMGGLQFMYSFNLFKASIYTHTVVKDFGYDSEYGKILIINPVPKKLHCHFGNKIEEIDNGALVGEYKIYTATAFVRAIETDTVERL